MPAEEDFRLASDVIRVAFKSQPLHAARILAEQAPVVPRDVARFAVPRPEAGQSGPNDHQDSIDEFE